MVFGAKKKKKILVLQRPQGSICGLTIFDIPKKIKIDAPYWTVLSCESIAIPDGDSGKLDSQLSRLTFQVKNKDNLLSHQNNEIELFLDRKSCDTVQPKFSYCGSAWIQIFENKFFFVLSEVAMPIFLICANVTVGLYFQNSF